MQKRQRKIVVLGAVLITASLLLGLLYDFLPLICLHIADVFFELLVCFCYGVSAIVFLGVAATVFAIACLFMNPVGILFLLGILWLVCARKPRLSQ